MVYCKFTEEQLDVLREIGNIGAGNVATSMSRLIKKRIYMEVPSVNIVTFDQMTNIVGGPEELVVAMFFRIHGEVQGSVYLVLSVEVAENLVSQMINDHHFTLLNDQSDEFAISALKEIGNMMTGAYLTALSNLMKVNLYPSIPYLSIDMAGAVLTEGLIHLSQTSDYAIVINTMIHNFEETNELKAHFFLIPDYESIPKIFSSLGINHHV